MVDPRINETLQTGAVFNRTAYTPLVGLKRLVPILPDCIGTGGIPIISLPRFIGGIGNSAYQFGVFH